MTISAKAKPDWSILGLLRFFLASIVVSVHFAAVGGRSFASVFSQLDGYTAVFCFLIVSGYSIAASIEARPSGFWMRRVKRLAPTYYFCLLFALAIVWSRHIPMNAWSPLAGLFCLNAVFVPRIPLFGITWSLTCELIFYAMAPLFARIERLAAGIAVLSFVLFAACPRMDWALYSVIDTAPRLAWWWIAGFLLFQNRDRPFASQIFAVVLAAGYLGNPNHHMAASTITLGVTWLAFWLARRQTSFGAVRQIGQVMGDLSYPMYLCHAPLRGLWTSFWLAHPAGYFAALIAVSAVIHFGIEAPLQKLASRKRGIDPVSRDLAGSRRTSEN